MPIATPYKPQLTVRVAPETLRDLKRVMAHDHLTATAHVQQALNNYLPPLLAKLEEKRDGTNQT